MDFNDYDILLQTLADNYSFTLGKEDAQAKAFEDVYYTFKANVFKTLTGIGQHPNREFLFSAAWAKYPRSWQKIFKDLEAFSVILDRVFQAVDKDQLLLLSAELVNKAKVKQELSSITTRSFEDWKNEQELVKAAEQQVMEAELEQAIRDMDEWEHLDNLDPLKDWKPDD